MLKRDSSPGGNEFHSYSAHSFTYVWCFYIILNLRDYHVGLDNDHPVYSPCNMLALIAFINFGYQNKGGYQRILKIIGNFFRTSVTCYNR
ncbi:hypothetical protein MNV_180049 [Candidatus Methanoperedens nitroreducens]|uniref:Uncharacterized protein n=1 Tax=Candidatus Methanoperedens nitratireducens TaxID=1392998 RepID=A0A284VMJ2_9EURY|nr:hypothetical protein MNV_180049 [Candidatus Methanoperedens nitroreducens]